MYFGAHVKSSGGVWHAIENGVELGAEAVQFLVKIKQAIEDPSRLLLEI